MQRLTLLLPVEEQDHSLEIVNGKVRKSVKNENQNGHQVKNDKSCRDKIVRKPYKDKNVQKSCNDKIVCHSIKDVKFTCTNLEQDLDAEDNCPSEQDLVAEGNCSLLEDLAAEERIFLAKADSNDIDSEKFPNVQASRKEDLEAEERTFVID